jgi:hypothetical protein
MRKARSGGPFAVQGQWTTAARGSTVVLNTICGPSGARLEADDSARVATLASGVGHRRMSPALTAVRAVEREARRLRAAPRCARGGAGAPPSHHVPRARWGRPPLAIARMYSPPPLRQSGSGAGGHVHRRERAADVGAVGVGACEPSV